MARLLTTVGTRIDLSGESFYVLGRAPECDILVADPASSRKHASLRVTGKGQVTIEDLGSHNGTYVNDSRLTSPLKLDDHSRIRIGTVTYLVSLEGTGQNSNMRAPASEEQLRDTVLMAGEGSHVVGGEPPQSSKWTESEIAGQIGSTTVVEVIHFVLASTSNGSLRFAFESGEGRIEIRGRALWDARTSDGHVGEAALIALTAITTGLFWIGPDPGPVQRTIFGTPSLLDVPTTASNPRSSTGTSTKTFCK